ncbi:MAG TPA: hypothetical protein VFE78_22670 [Gemmataceae bacterium]|jgi:hypothetical protein|nr:hypothetical protein [Gemmataceae bacterium]
MAPADIRNLTQRKPFIPFRLVTSDGTMYEVRHPDLVMIGLSSVLIGYPSEQDPQAYSRYDIVSMRHIVRLEPEQQAIAEP